MDKGFLHAHVAIVSVFMLLYLTKVYFLLTNNSDTLNNLRRKTKIADMVLGILILGTGVYLLIKTPVIETFLVVKIVLVLASIPVGIVAMKKNNKLLALIALFIYIYVFAVAKTNSLTFKKEAFITPVTHSGSSSGASNPIQEGGHIFTAKCAMCHGTDGKQMLNGAPDLSISQLTKTETISIIKSGKGLMPGFADEFNQQQLNALAAYAESLRKK